MASDSKPAAEPEVAAEVAVEQPAAVEQQPEAEAQEQPGDSDGGEGLEPDAGEEHAEEVAEVEGDPLPTHLAMKHPEGGSCGGYKADKDGVISVPVGEVETLLSHGFVPAASDE